MGDHLSSMEMKRTGTVWLLASNRAWLLRSETKLTSFLSLRFASACTDSHTHGSAPSGPLTPKPTATFPVSFCTYSKNIIQAVSNCSYPFGFPYIFLSLPDAVFFQDFQKQFASMFCSCPVESFWAFTSLQLHSAWQGSLVVETLTQADLLKNQLGSPTAAQIFFVVYRTYSFTSCH